MAEIMNPNPLWSSLGQALRDDEAREYFCHQNALAAQINEIRLAAHDGKMDPIEATLKILEIANGTSLQE